MNDLHAKFAITLVALGFFFTYAVPALKDMQHKHDFVIQQVSQPYASSSPTQPNAVSGAATVDGGQR